MALIIEDGSIIPNADAYVSIADVDTYNTNYVGDATWSSAETTDPQKERAIRKATQYIDSEYELKFKGVRTDETQSLQWPRTGVVYKDGVCVGSNEIPEPLLRATMEMAIRAISIPGPLVVDVQPGESNIKVNRGKAAVVEEEIEYFGAASTQIAYSFVHNLIKPLLTTNSVLRA